LRKTQDVPEGIYRWVWQEMWWLLETGEKLATNG
jgi:hypothetical protein